MSGGLHMDKGWEWRQDEHSGEENQLSSNRAAAQSRGETRRTELITVDNASHPPPPTLLIGNEQVRLQHTITFHLI